MYFLELYSDLMRVILDLFCLLTLNMVLDNLSVYIHDCDSLFLLEFFELL
jgi:hypothetical protein